MVTDPLGQPQPATFSAAKLLASIEQIETNLARYREAGRSEPRSRDDS